MGSPGRKRSEIGLAPGTLVHVGEKKAEKVVIRVLAYNTEKLIEKELESVEECLEFKRSQILFVDKYRWVGQSRFYRKTRKLFRYYPLPRRCTQYRTASKTENYDSYIYTVLKNLLDTEKEKIIIDQISIIIGQTISSLFRKNRRCF